METTTPRNPTDSDTISDAHLSPAQAQGVHRSLRPLPLWFRTQTETMLQVLPRGTGILACVFCFFQVR